MRRVKSASDERLARLLLVLGIAAGVGMTALGLLREGGASGRLPDGVVALVDGEAVSAEAFAQIEAAVIAERKGAPLDETQRQRLLDRLVDEELLLQRGIELGLARHEPSARRAIVSAVVATITSDAETSEPDDETLRRFYADEGDRFARPGRVDAQALFASTVTRPEAQAFQRAAEAARRLRAGEDFAAVDAALGDPQTAPLPGGSLPLETLRQYLGPSAAQAAATLAPGEITDPVRGGSGYYVVRLVARGGGEKPPFDDVRQEVRAEWLRTQGERALGDYLEGLREQADVKTRLPPPAAREKKAAP